MSASGGAVLGVDLGGTKCHAVVVDAAGRVVDQVYRSSDDLPDPVDVLLGVVGDLRASAAACGGISDGTGSTCGPASTRC